MNVHRVLKRGIKASSRLQKLTLKKQDYMLGRNLNVKIATNRLQVVQLVKCMNKSPTDLFLRKGKVQEKRKVLNIPVPHKGFENSLLLLEIHK